MSMSEIGQQPKKKEKERRILARTGFLITYCITFNATLRMLLTLAHLLPGQFALYFRGTL